MIKSIPHILLCPNAFKGAIDAEKAVSALRRGIERSGLRCSIAEMPIADGGNGSLKILARYLSAEIDYLLVNDPMGRPVKAAYGWKPDQKLGIVELAEASGIQLVQGRTADPWKMSTYGTGQLIDRLIELGARTIWVAVGGSATVDGALGILDALDFRFFVQDQLLKNPTPADLQRITRFEGVRNLEGIEWVVLCDVENPLLGPEGAAAVFGPQKGLSGEDIPIMDQGLAALAGVVEQQTGRNVARIRHGGAAGGVAAMLQGILGATLTGGGEKVLELSGFRKAVERCDILITGEGRIDEQTAYGKGPALVAEMGKAAGKKVIALSGSVAVSASAFPDFDVLLPICHGPVDIAEAIVQTQANLERTAFQMGKLLQILT